MILAHLVNSSSGYSSRLSDVKPYLIYADQPECVMFCF